MYIYDPIQQQKGRQTLAFSASARDIMEEIWVCNGRIVPHPVDMEGSRIPEYRLFQRHGSVKITTGREGTHISWAVFSANWASLFFTIEYLSTLPAPYTLNYYLAGWFHEEIAILDEARARIGTIVGKSDIHLQKRTFVKEATPSPEKMPSVLYEVMQNRMATPDITVDVAFDDLSSTFQVGRIGAQSLIARYYGMNPVSYPCQSFHTYHHIVSQAYLKVMETDKPHYDHVLAAFHMPDSSILWFPYQRVILPTRFPTGQKGVSVVSEAAKVDITLV